MSKTAIATDPADLSDECYLAAFLEALRDLEDAIDAHRNCESVGSCLCDCHQADQP